LDSIAQRDDVDRDRIGLWGADLGGYAAIAVAAADPHVRALVVDSVYDRPAQMLHLQVERSGLDSLPFVERFAQFGFRWLTYPYRHEPSLSARLARLAGVPKLYIEASDDPELAQSTRELFVRSPEPREDMILHKGNYTGMLGEEKRAYENRIVSFFLLKLPPSRPQGR
jgi:pimeloyl-ACP methyl ester carboxylesterase